MRFEKGAVIYDSEEDKMWRCVVCDQDVAVFGHFYWDWNNGHATTSFEDMMALSNVEDYGEPKGRYRKLNNHHDLTIDHKRFFSRQMANED